jgi:hypothetical protein
VNVKFHGIDIEPRLFLADPPYNTPYSIASVSGLPVIWTDRFTYVHQRLLMAVLPSPQRSTSIPDVECCQICKQSTRNVLLGTSAVLAISAVVYHSQLSHLLWKRIGTEYSDGELLEIPSVALLT